MNAALQEAQTALDFDPKPHLTVLAPQTNSIPQEIQHYAAFWSKYADLYHHFAAQVVALRKQERALVCPPGADYFYGIIPDPPEKQIEELHRSILSLLCRKAATAFAVPGSHLEINTTEIEELPQAKLDTFDPLALWKRLRETYDCEDGQAASYRNATKALQSASELNPYHRRNREENAEVRMVGGRLVLTVHVYGDWSYSFSSKETLVKFIKALQCVAIWAQIWNNDDEEAVDSIVNKIHISRDKDPRAMGRIEYWPLVTLIPYKEKFEFRLAPALAEQIQVFLATFPVGGND